jgi:hypothetical protein
MYKDIIALIIIVIISLIVLIGGVYTVQYLSDVYFLESNQINVFYNGNIVYSGKQAYVNISSGGMTTTVKIYSRLWPIMIGKETYSSNSIVITPKVK